MVLSSQQELHTCLFHLNCSAGQSAPLRKIRHGSRRSCTQVPMSGSVSKLHTNSTTRSHQLSIFLINSMRHKIPIHRHLWGEILFAAGSIIGNQASTTKCTNQRMAVLLVPHSPFSHECYCTGLLVESVLVLGAAIIDFLFSPSLVRF